MKDACIATRLVSSVISQMVPGDVTKVLLIAAVVSWLGVPVQAGETDASLNNSPERISSIAASLGVWQCQLCPVDMHEGADGEYVLHIQHDGKEVEIKLEPHSVRSSDYQLMVADEKGYRRSTVPARQTFRGHIVGQPSSRVMARQSKHGMQLLVREEDGSQWELKPTCMLRDDAQKNEYVRYNTNDLLDTPHTCGVSEEKSISTTDTEQVSTFTTRGSTTAQEVAVIACDADYEFFVENGSSVADTVAAVEELINGASDIFETAFNIRFEISTIVVRTDPNDPYTQTDAGARLSQVASVWNQSEFDGVRRDCVQMMTGVDMDGSTVGRAFTDELCDIFDAYSVIQPGFTAHTSRKIALSAHEIGHIFGSGHCDSAGDELCEIMCTSIGGCGEFVPLQFQSIAIDWINDFLSTNGGCLTPSSLPLEPPFFDDFPTETLDTTKWSFADGAEVNPFGFGMPSEPNTLKMTSDGSGEFDDHEIRTNTILLGGLTAPVLSYYVQADGPNTGESLIVEILNANGQWELVNEIISTGSSTPFVFHEHELSGDQVHDGFRLRFRTNGNNTNDVWFIDDVSIEGSGGSDPCPCDHNDSTEVDFFDLLDYLDDWFIEDPAADFNGSDGVDFFDLLEFLDCWFAINGPCPA